MIKKRLYIVIASLLSLTSVIEANGLRAAFENYQFKIQAARLTRPLTIEDAFFEHDLYQRNGLIYAFIFDLAFVQFFQANYTGQQLKQLVRRRGSLDKFLTAEELLLLGNPRVLRRRINRLESAAELEEQLKKKES